MFMNALIYLINIYIYNVYFIYCFVGNGCLFVKNSLLQQRIPPTLQNSLITKHFSLTSVASSNAVVEFFRARNFRAKRGPFRPGMCKMYIKGENL